MQARESVVETSALEPLGCWQYSSICITEVSVSCWRMLLHKKATQSSFDMGFLTNLAFTSRQLQGLSSTLVREGDGTPLQYSCLENPMDGGAWQAAVHGVAKSRTRLSDFTFTFFFNFILFLNFHFHFSLSCIGEGNGNPLPCSCLENARDGGAWWAAVYGVASSRTRLK